MRAELPNETLELIFSFLVSSSSSSTASSSCRALCAADQTCRQWHQVLSHGNCLAWRLLFQTCSRLLHDPLRYFVMKQPAAPQFAKEDTSDKEKCAALLSLPYFRAPICRSKADVEGHRETAASSLVRLSGVYSVDRVSSGKRLQGVWIRLEEDGYNVCRSYRPVAEEFGFVDKRVVVRCSVGWPSRHVQSLSCLHAQDIHSIELAEGETSYDEVPNRLPPPALVQRASDLLLLNQQWVRLVGIITSVQVDPQNAHFAEAEIALRNPFSNMDEALDSEEVIITIPCTSRSALLGLFGKRVEVVGVLASSKPKAPKHTKREEGGLYLSDSQIYTWGKDEEYPLVEKYYFNICFNVKENGGGWSLRCHGDQYHDYKLEPVVSRIDVFASSDLSKPLAVLKASSWSASYKNKKLKKKSNADHQNDTELTLRLHFRKDLYSDPPQDFGITASNNSNNNLRELTLHPLSPEQPSYIEFQSHFRVPVKRSPWKDAEQVTGTAKEGPPRKTAPPVRKPQKHSKKETSS
ncbi:hypothetical protein QOT17_016889 [Balamuthia mandrillaris]